MILAIDPGDLNRDGALKTEHLGKVRDGSTGEIVNGYPLMTVVARDLKHGHTLPVLTRLLSPRRQRVEQGTASDSHTPLWVIDRGGDRGTLWNTWLNDDWDVG